MARRTPRTYSHPARRTRAVLALAAAALLAGTGQATAAVAEQLPRPVHDARDASASPKPAAPAELSAEPTGPTTARLNWQPPQDGSGVAGYVVFQQGTSTPIAEVEADTLSTEVDSLEPGISYTFTVHSVDEKGQVSPIPRRVELVMPARADAP